MHLLLGYLVALAVFMGGGYAGVQWLLAPDDPAAPAQNSRVESASSRLINAKKVRDARARNRKLAESLAAEGVKPAVAPTASEAAAEGGEERSGKIADQSGARAAADAPQDAATPQVADTPVAANDPKLDARAEVSPVAKPEKIEALPKESGVPQRPAGKSRGESVAARKSAEAKTGLASDPSAGHSETAINKKQAASNKKRAERFASSSRKPIMMILRTIEFPDGRREQRLLPMSQARAGLARYGSVSAFADDDDF